LHINLEIFFAVQTHQHGDIGGNSGLMRWLTFTL